MDYRQKKIKVQAFQLTRDVEFDAPDWFAKALEQEKAEIDKSIVDGSIRVYGCTIRTPQGRMKAKIGDYIIREPGGSLCVRKSSVFKQLYAEAK